VIYLTKLNHANATPGWNSSKVSKYPILLFVGWRKGKGGRGGGIQPKEKRAKNKIKEEMENERTSTLAQLPNYM
jgi:hypothetical protein